MKARPFLSLILLVQIQAVQSQVLNINFNDNIIDQVNGFDPTYLVKEIETDFDEITFMDEGGDRVVFLDSASGFRLPVDVTTELRSATLWRFNMRFKIPDLGSGSGTRMLLHLRRNGTNGSPYFRFYTYRWRDQLGLQILTDDGVGNYHRLSGPIFDVDEWINLTLILDFENGQYTYQTDSYLASSPFTFDFENFMTAGGGSALQYQSIQVGSFPGLAARQNYDPASYSSSLIIDELSISTDLPTTDASLFENALRQLTDHLNEAITLTDTEQSTYVGEALANFKGNYLTSKTYVDAYLQAYEATHDPMFMHQDARNFYEEYNHFSWVAFNLQMDIFDNYATNEHVEQVDGVSFETGNAFPGPVSDTAPRLDNQTVPINGTYVADPGYNMKVREDDYGAFARRGTGFYAPPGEMITITVPNELINIGADVIIGTHTHDVSHKMHGINRLPRVIKEFEIYQTEMKVLNPVGGIIYIGVPEGTDLGSIDISISGAIKFAYYENSSTRETDINEFYALRDAEVTRWCETVTDNAMFTADLTSFSRNDVVEVVETYDRMWEVYQTAFGRPFPLHKAEHFTFDKKSKWNTLAGGYPMVIEWERVPFTDPFWVVWNGNMMNILEEDYYQGDHKVTYWHEMSHHTALPTIINPVNEHEVIVGLAYVIAFHEGFGLPLDSAMKYSERRRVTRDEAIIDWVVMDHFLNNEEMVKSERQYQQRGWSKYVDVAALFGWDGLGQINKVFYDQWTDMGGQVNDPGLNLITDSEWHLASNQGLNQNMAPLNHFWGEHPHDTLVATLNEFPRSLEVYNRLRYIRDFIPKTFEEFEPYYDKLAPTNVNSQNYLPYQNAYTDWDGTYAKIIDQIDWILEEYYGSDFDQDGYTFLEDCDDTDANIIPYDLNLELAECQSYEFDGRVLTNSGVYNASFTSVHGCDSLVQIDLRILDLTSGTQSIKTCESYEWNGVTYKESGIYDGLFTNIAGCDSTATLNLTIMEPSSSYQEVEACESYEWSDEVYTLSGTYERILTNAVGCDSVATLDLGILPVEECFETVLGIDSILISVYPNPTFDGTINLEGLPSGSTYKIFDSTGQEIHFGTNENKQAIIEGTTGVYLLQISTPQGPINKKIFKLRNR